MKTCTKCKATKSRSEFHLLKASSDGLHSWCAECYKAYKREYCIVNKEWVSTLKKKSYLARREILIERQRVYREENAEKERASQRIRSRLFLQTLKGKLANRNRYHKRRKLLESGDVTATQLKGLFDNAHVCYWCGVELIKAKEKHIDHFFPISKGGGHTLANLRVSCPKCNLMKRDNDPYIFAASIGRQL
jgi:5-methylcytosine-specific restriction endonuclease McrA